MNAFNNLRKFVCEEKRVSQIYQEVMLIELLKSDGQATVEQITQAILNRDPTQIEYFSRIVKNMVGMGADQEQRDHREEWQLVQVGGWE